MSSINEETRFYSDIFALWINSIIKNPFAWFIFISFLVLLNTIGWYYHYNLFGNAINNNTFYTNTSIKDLGFVVIFRIFEYICIFAFCFWMYKYGK